MDLLTTLMTLLTTLMTLSSRGLTAQTSPTRTALAKSASRNCNVFIPADCGKRRMAAFALEIASLLAYLLSKWLAALEYGLSQRACDVSSLKLIALVSLSHNAAIE